MCWPIKISVMYDLWTLYQYIELVLTTWQTKLKMPNMLVTVSASVNSLAVWFISQTKLQTIIQKSSLKVIEYTISVYRIKVHQRTKLCLWGPGLTHCMFFGQLLLFSFYRHKSISEQQHIKPKMNCLVSFHVVDNLFLFKWTVLGQNNLQF